MVALTKQPHKFRRGNVYYFRIAVPVHLQCTLGCEYKRSLKTGDARLASRLCRIMSNKAEDFFIMVSNGKIPSQTDLRRLMRMYFEEQLNKARNELSSVQGMFLGSEPEEAAADPYGLIEQSNREYQDARALVASYGTSAEHENSAQIMLEQHGYETLPSAEVLAEHFSKAMIEVCRIKQAFISNDFQNIEIQHPELKGCYNVFKDFEERAEIVPEETERPTLAECIAHYVEHKKVSVETRTYKTINAYLDRLCDILGGERSIDSITKKRDGRLLESTLLKIPAHFVRDHKSRGKQLMEMVDGDEDYKTISNKTANSHWIYFNEFFNWAIDREYLEHNPIQGMTFRYAKNRREKSRLPFTAEQLDKLFNSSIYTGRKNRERRLWEEGRLKIKDGNFWLPVIGLYTGMRLAEILYLTPSDIKERDGVYYIDINEDFCKRTKNPQSLRKVPIHPELIKIGLLSYVAGRKRKIGQNGRIFEDGITIPDKQDITKNYSRSFSDYTVKVGVRAEKNNKEVFHSFRHNMSTALYNEGISSLVRAYILGHEPAKDSVTTGDTVYTHGEPKLDVLYDNICKVNYGIDLSHLYDE